MANVTFLFVYFKYFKILKYHSGHTISFKFSTYFINRFFIKQWSDEKPFWNRSGQNVLMCIFQYLEYGLETIHSILYYMFYINNYSIFRIFNGILRPRMRRLDDHPAQILSNYGSSHSNVKSILVLLVLNRNASLHRNRQHEDYVPCGLSRYSKCVK